LIRSLPAFILSLLTFQALATAPGTEACNQLLFKQLGLTYLGQSRYEANVATRTPQEIQRRAQHYDQVHQEFIAQEGGLEPARAKIKAKISSLEFAVEDLGRAEIWVQYSAELDQSQIADVTIKQISANIGYGVFANKPIKKGELIGEYTGVISRDLQKDMTYMMGTLDGYYSIDAKFEGNETRFINHSKHAANSVPLNMFHNFRWRVLLVASKEIQPGEQILFDYGSGYWSDRTPPQDLGIKP